MIQFAIKPNSEDTESLEAFKHLVFEIHNSRNQSSIQKAVNDYVTYRHRMKERRGEGGPISSLFSHLNLFKEFKWESFVENKCSCGKVFKKSWNPSILKIICTNDIISQSGNIMNCMESNISDFLIKCTSKCNGSTLTKIQHKKIPSFIHILMEYPEDIDQKLVKMCDIPVLKIEENFLMQNDYKFQLSGIIYFQHLHYTIHVKGISHPTLIPLSPDNWYYHDGKENNGNIVQKKPNFQIDLRRDTLRPYILVYKVNE
jgi:hypothetical protein